MSCVGGAICCDELTLVIRLSLLWLYSITVTCTRLICVLQHWTLGGLDFPRTVVRNVMWGAV
jgi:hypothetical protein